MNLRDEILKYNLEEDNTPVVETPVPEDNKDTTIDITNKLPRTSSIGDYINKINNQLAYDEVEGAYVNYKIYNPTAMTTTTFTKYDITNQVAKSKAEVEADLDTLESSVSYLLGIVEKYRNSPDEISFTDISSFRQHSNKIVEILGASKDRITISNEEDFVGFTETMQSILALLADQVDIIKSKMISYIVKIQEELENTAIASTRALIAKTQTAIDNKPTKVVSIVDHILEDVSKLENPSETSIRAIVEHHEYIISAANEDEGLVKDAIGGFNLVEEKTIKELVFGVFTFINTINKNPVAKMALNSGNLSKYIKNFVTDTLPRLNNYYKGILVLLNDKQDSEFIVDKTSYIKDTINKQLIAFLVNSDTEEEITFMCHDKGYYKVENDVIFKQQFDINPNVGIDLNYDRVKFITSLVATVEPCQEHILAFPETLVKLLQSDELTVEDTSDLVHLQIVLGTILGSINIYREQILYGVDGLLKAISHILVAYYNLIRIVDKR